MRDYSKRLHSGGTNLSVAGSQIPAYLCPTDDAEGRKIVRAFARSNYAACFGSTTLAPFLPQGHQVIYLEVQTLDFDGPRVENDGVFRLQGSKRGRQLRRISDGTSHTVMLSELLAGHQDGNVESDQRGLWISTHAGGSMYTHQLTPNSSAPDGLFYCIDVFSPPSPPGVQVAVYVAWAAARSRHPGGVNVAFGDGHIECKIDEIDLVTWQALATIAGGEVISDE